MRGREQSGIAQFAETLKREAVQAVMKQGAAWASLVNGNVGNVETHVCPDRESGHRMYDGQEDMRNQALLLRSGHL
jgi:hypothetical protein